MQRKTSHIDILYFILKFRYRFINIVNNVQMYMKNQITRLQQDQVVQTISLQHSNK